jgi:hypothetical protein
MLAYYLDKTTLLYRKDILLRGFHLGLNKTKQIPQKARVRSHALEGLAFPVPS